MGTEHTVLILIGMLLLAIAIQPLARRIHLPFTATLVIAGFGASELLVSSGFDTGIRAQGFHDLIFFVFLPILIFESAYNINVRLLCQNLLPILILAIPLMLLSTLITAVLVYYGIGHASGFPWIAALITGALLSATDPVAVVAMFKQMGVPPRLAILVEGESLFNDATAIVIFGVFIAIATGSDGPMTFTDAALHFARVFFGGMLVGAVTGLLFTGIVRLLQDTITRSLATVLSAYVSFVLAESFLHVSGVMSVLVNALVFLLMGVVTTTSMFEERWLAMLIGIAAVLVARAIGIFVFVPLLNRATPIEPISRPYQAVMMWGGLRGAVTLALALSLPVTLDYWWTIQSIAFGVVIFTLFAQATSTGGLLRHYGLDKK
jgi:CPA1 family monovalent cation:H+ antiporter